MSFNAPEDEILRQYSEFIKGARDARHYEMEHVGNDPQGSIARYETVNNNGFELFNKIDMAKVTKVDRWSYIFTTKEFLLGVAASLFAAGLVCFVSYVSR